jgi:hypothetical protein
LDTPLRRLTFPHIDKPAEFNAGVLAFLEKNGLAEKLRAARAEPFALV